MSSLATAEPFALDRKEGEPYWFLGTLTTIKATGETTDGSFSMVEQLAPPGISPPLHVHHEDDELFFVLEGTVEFQVGDDRLTVGPGSTVYGPHGVPHSYLTTTEARLLVLTHEPGFEGMFAEVGRPAESWTIPEEPPSEAEIERVHEVADEYGFELLGPPLELEE